MSWALQIGNITVDFKSTPQGALGYKFSSSGNAGGVTKYFVPTELGEKEVFPYNPKNPQENFYDRRYFDGKDKYYKAEEVIRKYFDKEKPDVYISREKMKEMFPLTKQAKAISKQSMEKLNLRNISASEGYYLLPDKDYNNIQKYKKMLEFIGDDFIITSPIRLTVSSVTSHTYAIFVDKKQNALVAVEVLVKDGFQEEPKIGGV